MQYHDGRVKWHQIINLHNGEEWRFAKICISFALHKIKFKVESLIKIEVVDILRSTAKSYTVSNIGNQSRIMQSENIKAN